MSLRTASDALTRITKYCSEQKITEILLTLHGGEPLLVKRKWYSAFFSLIEKHRTDNLKIELALQTNATLLSDAWIDFLIENNVGFGISVDGPKEVNDEFRVDHRGRGSYVAVERAIRRLVARQEIEDKWGGINCCKPAALTHQHS